MKKIFYLLIICFCCFLSLIVINVNVSADSNDAYLIMTNPADDCNTKVTITWHSKIIDTFVEYTLKEDTDFSESIKIKGIYEELTIYDGTTNGEVADYKCYVTLENLLSDTEYIYRVGKNNMSDVHTFKTGGEDNFNFAVVSDIHVYSKLSSRLTKAEDIINKMNNKASLSFVLSVGDTLAYGTHRGYWDDLCNSSIINNYIFAPTPGNHDYYNGSAKFLDSSYFNAYTKNPSNGPKGMENTTYYFYYNNIMFISLNSEDACTNTSKKQLQREWLIDVLENNNANFIVVYFHRSMYPGSGSNKGHATTMKDAYQDLFDKYGVDVVFGGHDHVYVRTAKILGGTTSPSSMFGTTYISLPQIGDRASSANSDYTDVAKKFGSISGGLLFKATKDSLSFELIDDSGEVLDGGLVASKMSLFDQKKFERYTKIDYENNFSNMKLSLYEGLFQRAINVKVYKGQDVLLDFRPEYNKTEYSIPNVSDISLKEEYKLVITYRDDSVYEKDITVENKDLDISFTSNDITCFIDEMPLIVVNNSLDLDFDYQFEYDDEYLEIKENKLYPKKVGNTIIKVLVDEEEVLQINVTINEIIKYYATLNLGGGTLDGSEEKILVDELNNLKDPVKEGFVFDGWYLDAEFANPLELKDFNEDITIYAKWKEVVTEKNQGCNNAAVFYYSLLLLGLCIIRRKKI